MGTEKIFLQSLICFLNQEWIKDTQLTPHSPKTFCTALDMWKGQLYKHEGCRNYRTAPLVLSSHLHGKKAGEKSWKKQKQMTKQKHLEPEED